MRDTTTEVGDWQSRDCPVCRAHAAEPFLVIDRQRYWRCGRCAARFLDATCHPTREEEAAHYRLHQNAIGDPGYRGFLAKLARPLLARLTPGSRGLDFGCGPGPALAAILQEAGHTMALYDPFFQPDVSPLALQYDFVTCSETIEHFHRPAETFDRLRRLVAPGGWLGVMTCFQTDDALFPRWHYRQDPTHVVFYREQTLRHLARGWGWSCEVPGKDVALMQRPVVGSAA